jgi:hypothetical protein
MSETVFTTETEASQVAPGPTTKDLDLLTLQE